MTSKEEANKLPGFVILDILKRHLVQTRSGPSDTRWMVMNLEFLHRDTLHAIREAVEEERRACREIARTSFEAAKIMHAPETMRAVATILEQIEARGKKQ